LNIYEKDDTRVVALYRGLYNALKVNGTLICSALSTPPSADAQTEWDMSKIDQPNLQTAGALFRTVLEATWANFRSSEKTCAQLKEAGFEDVEIHWDSQRIFPTFTARKAALRC
ncbi:MAG: SAM-dependent methyltransferase, partial [Gammaproteobacteria bacterium]|nr:SAM-dependent methyltransferase [Gammaproteobacteria bacterium]